MREAGIPSIQTHACPRAVVLGAQEPFEKTGPNAG